MLPGAFSSSSVYDAAVGKHFFQPCVTGHRVLSGEIRFTLEQGKDIINISLADGLSGTYQTAVSAREMV